MANTDLVDRADLALAQFSESVKRTGSIDTALTEAVNRYPEYATLISDAACAASLQAQPDQLTEADYALAASAMRRFSETHAPVLPKSLALAAKKLQLNTAGLLKQLRIGHSIWAKLERRNIKISTMPNAFLVELADLLLEPVDVVIAYLSQPPVLSSTSESRSDHNVKGISESFSRALLTSLEEKEIDQNTYDSWRALLAEGPAQEGH